MVDPAFRLTAQEEKDLNKFQKFFSYKVCISNLSCIRFALSSVGLKVKGAFENLVVL